MKDKEKWDWIISYYSQRRLLFEFITCIMVIYDCVIAPITFAYGKSDIFSPKVGFIVDLVSYFNSFVFLTDILAGFRKAYLN